MHLTVKAATGLLFLTSAIGLATLNQPAAPPDQSTIQNTKSTTAPKIQAAILLDVSNSMDGLIEQAKAQLWNMVSVMGKAKCNDATPQIEIALYEYGSPRNPAAKGFVKQITPFTTDLDALSKHLFNLTTNGGSEYCGQVIYTALDELAWDTSTQSYKVIFIAGNEDFLQGSLHYTKACTEAAKKGVIVNTIYCGDKMQGIREHWNLAGECGEGSYTNINQDAKLEDIPTPYDSTIFVLNSKLNNTYVGYGSQAVYGFASQASVDQLSFRTNKSAALKRISVKGKKELYKNSNWDLVDAAAADSTIVTKVEVNSLPDSLKKLSKAQLKEYVKTKSTERSKIQEEIAALSVKREAYLAEERKKQAGTKNEQTLESETEKLIIHQAKKYNMHIQ